MEKTTWIQNKKGMKKGKEKEKKKNARTLQKKKKKKKMDRKTWPQLWGQNNMARGVMEGHHSQKKINALPMQEFNSLIVYLDMLYKNYIKNWANKNKESRYNNHVISCKQMKTNWEKTNTQQN